MPLIFAEEGVGLRLASGSHNNLRGPLQSSTPIVSTFGPGKQNFSYH